MEGCNIKITDAKVSKKIKFRGKNTSSRHSKAFPLENCLLLPKSFALHFNESGNTGS